MTSVLQFKQAKTMYRIDLAYTIQAAFENESKFNQNDENKVYCVCVCVQVWCNEEKSKFYYANSISRATIECLALHLAVWTVSSAYVRRSEVRESEMVECKMPYTAQQSYFLFARA